MAPYVIIVDAISKAFARDGTSRGLGGCAAPTSFEPMNDVVGHVGAWAPRAEQVATAKLPGRHDTVDRYMRRMRREASHGSTRCTTGLTAMQRDGLPVEAIRPQGAIYVSARFALARHVERRTEICSRRTRTSADYLLNEAGLCTGSVRRVRV